MILFLLFFGDTASFGIRGKVNMFVYFFIVFGVDLSNYADECYFF